MKIDIIPTSTEERVSLAEKLRLRKPQVFYSARILMKLSEEEARSAHSLDLNTLARWAGPKLKDLVFELERAGKGKAAAADVIINKSVASPEEAKALGLRASVFSNLVAFSLAEQRLADTSNNGLVVHGTEGEPVEDLALDDKVEPNDASS